MSRIIKGILSDRKLASWNNTPKDLVILHCFGRDKTLPSGSPYINGKDPMGPKGKAPWISCNGDHVADSEHILAYLNRTFGKDLNKGHQEKSLALATATRIMLEDQFSWGMALERFVFNPQEFRKVFGRGPLHDFMVLSVGGYIAKKRAVAQGIGIHSREEIEEFVGKNLRAVSALLGGNKFFLGERPCQDDCAIFGQLAQTVWGLPNSNYEKLVHNELTNLRDYCYRFKDLYYPDWAELTSRKKKAS